jgi:hypothetical protein
MSSSGQLVLTKSFDEIRKFQQISKIYKRARRITRDDGIRSTRRFSGNQTHNNTQLIA